MSEPQKRHGRYSIWIASLPGYTHSSSFMWQARALQHSFGELGYDVPIVTDQRDIRGTAIVLAANLLPYIKPKAIPLIIYNLEQIEFGSPWLTDDYINILKSYPVWDYSQENIIKLQELGVDARLCEIGYSPVYTHIIRADVPDIPILFYGSGNERRTKIINSLNGIGLKTHAAFNVYGDDLDGLISRAKIVLNMHYYEAKVFEITRCSYLFANSIPVVSEYGHGDEMYRATGGFAPYDDIIAKCRELLFDDAARLAVGKKGFEIFSKTSQTEMLKAVL